MGLHTSVWVSSSPRANVLVAGAYAMTAALSVGPSPRPWAVLRWLRLEQREEAEEEWWLASEGEAGARGLGLLLPPAGIARPAPSPCCLPSSPASSFPLSSASSPFHAACRTCSPTTMTCVQSGSMVAWKRREGDEQRNKAGGVRRGEEAAASKERM
jgi:hypothetical protein